MEVGRPTYTADCSGCHRAGDEAQAVIHADVKSSRPAKGQTSHIDIVLWPIVKGLAPGLHAEL